jgi:membrane-anchored protein YejM (alkaline phosphatase superfamily)
MTKPKQHETEYGKLFQTIGWMGLFSLLAFAAFEFQKTL